MERTHIGCEDISVAAMQNFTLEIRSQWPYARTGIVLEGDEAICRKGTRLTESRLVGGEGVDPATYQDANISKY